MHKPWVKGYQCVIISQVMSVDETGDIFQKTGAKLLSPPEANKPILLTPALWLC
jgi:hypothetical protein